VAQIIITSRPEVDIQRFFDAPAQSSHLRYDLAADERPPPTYESSPKTGSGGWLQSGISNLLGQNHRSSTGVISRAAGLFIFIKTVALALEQCKDPTESLKATLQDSDVLG
jgi:hypothetical protein